MRLEDRQTDTTELIVAFRNFANAPKTPSITTKILCLLYREKFVHKMLRPKQAIAKQYRIPKNTKKSYSTISCLNFSEMSF
jgi:hypothetical protein